MARFDFAKKFAQLIQDEERGTEGGASPRGSSVKPSVRAVEGREEAREAEADPESTGTSSTLREAVSDSLQSMRKADLTKGPASSNLVSLEEADIQTESSVISEAEDLMALMREGEEEREEAGERRIQEGSPHNHSNGERHKPNTKRPDSVASLPRHPPCARHVLDQAIAECRGAFAELEKELAALEVELPQCINYMDEQIASLHNLKLDFMLELGWS